MDISKAYERLEWGYISAVLSKMGFEQRWINLVMGCVSTVNYWVRHQVIILDL